jgi:hypothetical protein
MPGDITTALDGRLKRMYEFDEGAELSKNFYEPDKIDAVNGLYVMDADEKKRLEKKQIELYLGGESEDHL